MLYHHGCPQRRQLMTGDGRDWLGAQPLPATAREQVTVALAMIDALDRQLAPLDKELRAYARRQTGCKALMRPLRDRASCARSRSSPSSVTARRFSSSRDAVRYAGMDITVYQSDRHRAPGHLSAKDRRRCAGRCSRPRSPPARPGSAPTATTTCRRPSGSVATARACRSRASCSSALPHAARARRGGARSPHDLRRCAPSPSSHRCAAAGSRHAPAATPAWTA